MTFALLLGFFLGMRHALDSDHLAAVAALAGSGGRPRIVRLGVLWALGHSATLVALGSVILASNGVIPPELTGLLECLVGLLLIVLGVGTVYRVLARRVHIHAHHHGSSLHLHAHTHYPSDPDNFCHDHGHNSSLARRAVLVGVTHGLAGSAALVLLTLATMDSVWMGIGYILIFGIGTIAGMGLLSCVIALPLRLLATRLTVHYHCLVVLVGVWSAALGGTVIYHNLDALTRGF